MCRLKSGILLEDRVYIGEGDSHTDMLEELGIEDTEKNAERCFIRAELYPKDGDVFSPIDGWVWNVDQDITPDWYVPEYDEQCFREAVKTWAKDHIFIDVDGLALKTGSGYYLKNCSNVVLSGNANVTVLKNSQVSVMREGSRIDEMREGSRIDVMRGSSWVGEMREGSQVGAMWEGSQVGEMRGSSTATILNNNSVNPLSVNLCDNATIKDNRTKTIYQSGDWKLVLVENK